jgi:hypothetical protein
MAARGPRSRGFRPCRRGPCLCAVLALVTPAAAGAPAPDLPDWLAARLRATTAGPAGDRPPWVARYEYRGGTVYYLPPRCCDIPSELYDAAGDLLCRPDGGFVDGDARCPDFLARRRGGEIVWGDGRDRGGPPAPGPGRVGPPDAR